MENTNKKFKSPRLNHFALNGKEVARYWREKRLFLEGSLRFTEEENDELIFNEVRAELKRREQFERKEGVK